MREPMLVTGSFGKGNDDVIEETAVAAGATVGHRVRVTMQLADPRDILFGPNGFLIFAPCKKPE